MRLMLALLCTIIFFILAIRVPDVETVIDITEE